MWLFGSALDESQFNDESDIDFIVEFESFPILDYADNYFDLKDKLETGL
jgi:predicted nucleotidyltransferase